VIGPWVRHRRGAGGWHAGAAAGHVEDHAADAEPDRAERGASWSPAG